MTSNCVYEKTKKQEKNDNECLLLAGGFLIKHRHNGQPGRQAGRQFLGLKCSFGG